MDENAGIFQYLTFFFSALKTPAGFTFIIIGIVFGLFVLITERGRWFAFSLLLLAGIASLFETATEATGYHVNFTAPTAAFTRLGRPLVCALLFIMTLRALIEKRGWRQIRPHPSVISLALLQVLFASRFFYSGEPVRGALSICMTGFLFVGVYGLLARSLQEIADIRTLQKMILLAGFLFAFICGVEYIHDPASVLAHQRFTGISGNPQFAAIFLAIQSVTCISMLLGSNESKWTRIFLVASLAIFSALLLWTGSRTGVLMVVVGAIVLVRSQITKWIALLVILTIAILIGSILFPDSLNVVARFSDVTNTRAENFTIAYEIFRDHMLIGDPNFLVVESSYLSTAAATGLIGLTLLAVFMLSHLRSLLRALRMARELPELKKGFDYVLVLSFSLATGAALEGFLLGYATASIIFVYITLGLTQFVLDYGQAHRYPDPSLQYPNESSLLVPTLTYVG